MQIEMEQIEEKLSTEYIGLGMAYNNFDKSEIFSRRQIDHEIRMNKRQKSSGGQSEIQLIVFQYFSLQIFN